VSLGKVTAQEITESSGVIASRQNPGVLWTHNDSGFPGTVFALSTNGALLARYSVPNAFFGDYEDISFGPGPSPEWQYIYLGDIGDNFSSRPNIRVFRFPEPAVYAYQSNNPPVASVAGWEEIVLTYPDGPFNAEALMVDPLSGDLFFAAKLTNSARIYRATRAELDGGGPIALTFIREISFFKVSGGDISSDGKLVALRRGGKAWAWVRQSGQSIGDALGGSGVEIPVATEPNGEAIGFHPTGLGYYTLSEGLNQTNYYYRRTDSGVPKQPVVLIKPGEVWRYSDLGSDEGTAWRQPAFDDSSWASGPAQLGYGQGDEQTVISFGPDDFAKNPTTYFRKQFTQGTSVTLSNLALRICGNDGVAVYLNGVEVLRRRLAPDAAFDQLATAPNADWQNYWFSFPINPAQVHAGTNTIAVEVHRFDPSGPGLSFDLQLVEGFVDSPARFTGLPVLNGGQCLLRIVGPAGSLVTVEGSSDFQQWSVAGQVVLTGGAGQFQESASSNGTQRFYRLRN